MRTVKAIMAVVGVAAIMMGCLWILQGLDIVRWPSTSFMLGDIIWARNGVILATLGVLMMWFAQRRR